jgi:hypothetical protein
LFFSTANFGKASYLHGGEAKIKTELAVVERKIKGHKQDFGIELFGRLVEKEDKEGWLPTDRQVRNMYDTCRGDIQRLESKKKAKADEIIALGGSSGVASASASASTTSSDFIPPSTTTTTSTTQQPSTFAPQQSSFSDNPGGFSDTVPTISSSSQQPQNNNDEPVDLLL